MENIKLPDDPEKPLTWGAFFEYVSNHENAHEELIKLIHSIEAQFDSTQSSFNENINLLDLSNKTLKRDIFNLKDVMGELNEKIGDFGDFEDIRDLKNELKELLISVRPALGTIKTADELVQKQIHSLTQQSLDNDMKWYKKLLTYWPVVAGVATTISVLLSGLYVIVNWSLRTGLSHYEQDNIKNQKQVLSIFKEYKSKIDSSNMMISANIESNRRKLKSQAEISNIINLKINTIHGLKEK
jgi:hypothetical protein